MADRQVDPVTRALIKSQEGFASTAYVDAQGHSIGYGHFIRKGEEHLLKKELTKEEAEELLEKDIKSHQDPWASRLTKSLNNNQMAALTSFAYNVGPGAVQKLIPEINRGNFDAVFAKMREYNKARVGPEAKLTVLPVLEKRREFEIELFQKEDGDIDVASEWKSSKGIIQRIKETFTGTKKQEKGFFDDSGLLGQNKQVLEGLYALNSKMRSGPIVDVDESAWAARVMEEGRGW